MIDKPTRSRALIPPYFIIIWPLVFLALWIPPFFILGSGLFAILGVLADYPMQEMHLSILDYGTPFCYAMLIGGTLLNFGNAVYLSMRQRYEDLESGLQIIRRLCIGIYPSLLWGILPAIFFLLGPDRNEHILFLIVLSLPALNLSGAFYAVPLVLQLRRKEKISQMKEIIYIFFSFVIGLDLLAAFYLRKELKSLV